MTHERVPRSGAAPAMAMPLAQGVPVGDGRSAHGGEVRWWSISGATCSAFSMATSWLPPDRTINRLSGSREARRCPTPTGLIGSASPRAPRDGRRGRPAANPGPHAPPLAGLPRWRPGPGGSPVPGRNSSRAGGSTGGDPDRRWWLPSCLPPGVLTKKKSATAAAADRESPGTVIQARQERQRTTNAHLGRS